ncbi:MAG: hypothetical protein MJ069_06490 [Salinivirgaceae bacterium]|nr:hypothetical protein [Salinivirgaceae bacterium]
MNWKKLGLSIYRDFLQYRQLILLSLAFAIVGVIVTLADNYSPFMENGSAAGVSFGLLMGVAFMLVSQFFTIFKDKKSTIPFMMVPASNLVKFMSKVIVLAIAPVMLICIAKAVETPVVGSVFVGQIGVEKTAENMELFHPEEIECTNFFTSETRSYQNDSVIVMRYGRFNNVVVNKYHNDWIQVGINSTAFGDIMFFIGIIGIMIFSQVCFNENKCKSIASFFLGVILVWGIVKGITKVFYHSMSVSVTENFILLASVAMGLIGLFFLWRAYKIFDNKQIN